jgi:hypothetical protein
METWLMSGKERERLEVLARVKARQITQAKAAELLGLSYRQVLRIYARYTQGGAAGLVHRLRGRASNHRCPAGHRQKVLAAYRRDYADFGPTLAAEQMLKRQKLKVEAETLRRWLVAERLWKGMRRRQKHRSRRERKAHAGELVQLDGSPHAWLEGRGPGLAMKRMSLIELVDDATGRSYGRFYPEETTAAVMDCFGRYIARHGLPRALYVDKDSIYVVNNREATGAEILEHREPLTQLGRAAEELGVKIIVADSPQAKGRVERVHGTHQDRLVKLLRLEQIDTMEAANAYLEKHYWEEYNQKFAKPAAKSADLHRALSKAKGLELGQVLCLKEPRTVGRDWCVCYEKRVLQIAAKHQSLALAGQRVEVREHLDGAIQLWFRGRMLGHTELAARPQTPKAKPVFENRQVYKPSADHPYNRTAAGRGAGSLGSSATPQSPGTQHGNVTVLLC